MLKNSSYKVILTAIFITVLVMGVILFIIPPALFPDPANGLQVLRCMKLGSSFNTFVSPDQSDISQNYTEYLTWWSPGQYLVPYFFKLITGANMGRSIAITVTLAELLGLAGFYAFFKKIGFTPFVSSISLLFIASQQAFMVPFVYYNGGEILLFAFEGWFLYGCARLTKTDFKLLLFVLLSGWIGFFLKSSFLWIYAAGLVCVWIRLSSLRIGTIEWVKKGLWLAIPAVISFAVIYLGFISKGQSPTSSSNGIKITAETFSFPLASPILSGFSVDDLVHGLIFHTGKPVFNPASSIAVLLLLALLSLLLVFAVIKYVPNDSYKLFIGVFYVIALLFFGVVYLRRLSISYEARHFRIIGLLIIPGVVYLAGRFKGAFRIVFSLIFVGIAYTSFNYLIKGYEQNNLAAKGSTGIAQPNVDQAALNAILKLDKENSNALFVFISNDTGLEILHNRIITMPAIGDNLKIDIDDYKYAGFAGPLYLVLPESYNGPKEKLMMKSFPQYAGWNISMLSPNYVLYEAKLKRGAVK
ncbi:hypothetical protein JN11_02554 [Mucilaginibacter frigoritolerans]|jgi:hypothetical protein|uniref:Dolichyl-phosphate-mannose-protein mannosyltransferase n=1 Tax=Mucilaginibacter frigoritolerans TaxID=652788 RepID=A0A562U0E7_9SPHI|nr:hypothetical protein [Mucilaginibacter frigoritolerans]TWI99237.1 hypothetical protein JN11_02554 [Mucilaginibacter frigoritolerans]